MYVLVVAALVLQSIGTYLIWPSRWNIPAHLALGFCVTAYLVPGLLTDVWDFADPATNALYAQINIVGALALIAGLFVGRKVALFDEVSKRFLKLYESARLRAAVLRRIEFISTYAVLGMAAAYIIMGFIPMFAEDPFAAKQFKDQYFEPYHRAAYLFRGSFSILVAAIPLLFVIWWIRRRRIKPLILGLSAVGLITVSLARQSSALGVLTFLGLIGARSRKGTRRFMFLTAVIYPLGSAAYLLLGLLTGITSFTTIYSVNSVADIVSSGAPDIHDQLYFLEGFRYLNTFTYGKTFWGGLVPGNYMWNPSVWTLTYDNPGADISDWITGGYRFTTALWGYCDFGWVGVLLVPFLSGLLTGAMIRALRKLPLDKSLLASALVMSVYMTFGSQITEFFALSIHNIPSIICALYACFGLPRLFRRRRGAAATLSPAH